MSFSRIAVATDGSANAERALTAAIDIARHYDAKLVLVHAVMGGALPQSLLEWAKVEHLVDAGTAGAGSAEQSMPPDGEKSRA